MGSNFKFSASDMRKLEKQVTKDLQKQTQQFFDKFAKQHSGRPVAEVKTALAREWKKFFNGGSITDPELTDYAKVISEGGKVIVR